jgi:hypothetical protein
MCGNDGIFHGTILKPRITMPFSQNGDKAAKAAKKAAADQLAANAEVEAANLQTAATKRRRRLSSLFAGGRSVLGAASGRGAPGGGGTPGGQSGGSYAGGSAMGGSRPSGGSSGFGNGLNRN